MFKPILTVLTSLKAADIGTAKKAFKNLCKEAPEFGCMVKTYRAENCFHVPMLFLVIAKYYGMLETEITAITAKDSQDYAKLFIHDLWICSAVGGYIDANIAENNQTMREMKDDAGKFDPDLEVQTFVSKMSQGIAKRINWVLKTNPIIRTEWEDFVALYDNGDSDALGFYTPKRNAENVHNPMINLRIKFSNLRSQAVEDLVKAEKLQTKDYFDEDVYGSGADQDIAEVFTTNRARRYPGPGYSTRVIQPKPAREATAKATMFPAPAKEPKGKKF